MIFYRKYIRKHFLNFMKLVMLEKTLPNKKKRLWNKSQSYTRKAGVEPARLLLEVTKTKIWGNTIYPLLPNVRNSTFEIIEGGREIDEFQIFRSNNSSIFNTNQPPRFFAKNPKIIIVEMLWFYNPHKETPKAYISLLEGFHLVYRKCFFGRID